MAYNPNLKLYYYKPNESGTNATRFVPIPLISIEPELLYVNDIVIGYNYNINLQGYATALDLTTYTGGDLNFTNTLEAVQHVRDILSCNGNTLLAKDETGDVIVASGGLLQSLTFEETENNWFNYARYNAQLSFSSLYLSDCDSITKLQCDVLPSGIDSINAQHLADMEKYKVKSVQDGWTIDTANVYNSNPSLSLQNEYLDISYNVQAVGKHFISNNSILPAWQQAKNYCINRLKQEVGRLNNLKIGPVTSTNQNTTCTTSTSMSGLSSEELQGLFYQLPSGDYKIYNETIECSHSESDGSFSIDYKSILKRIASNHAMFSGTHCIHRITTNRSSNDDGSQKTITETVEGEIEGLIEGGLINSFEALEIPNTGYVLNIGTGSGTKYANALDAYNKIINTGPSIGRELKSELVAGILNITNSGLDPLAPNGSAKPKKNSHNVTHNFNAGTISYSEDYNNNHMFAHETNSISNISVSVTDDLDILAEFVVPGRAAGPIIQRFAGRSPKKLSVSIDGSYKNANCCDLLASMDGICATGLTLPVGVPGTGLAGYEITENRHNINTTDGSYTINRSYMYIG